MSTAKQVMDFRASKGITKAQSDEEQRVRSEKARDHALRTGNYDLTREHLNFEVTRGGVVRPIDTSKSIPQLMKENLAARGIKDPNEGLEEPRFRTVVNFILGGSRERMHEIAFGDQKVNLDKGADNSHIHRTKEIEQWAKDMYQFMSDEYGEDNIVTFYVHLDEMNPHCHCTILPIDKDNKFAYKKIFAGKDKFEYKARTLALHDRLAKVNEKWGLGRGTSITETGARHRSTEEYRRDLDAECSSLADEIRSHKRTLSELDVEIKKAGTRVKGLNTMIGNLNRQKGDLEARLAKVNADLITGEGDKLAVEKQKEELENSLAEIEAKLVDKTEKLHQADQMLEKLRNEQEDIKSRTAELREEGRAPAQNVQLRIKEEVSNAMYENVVNDFRLRLPQMGESELQAFDGSLLLDVAEHGNEIVRCATMLFAGYVDMATQFAKTHGGGGSSPSSGWGRDPKDDDREWARRCVAMAARMLHPSSGKKIRR